MFDQIVLEPEQQELLCRLVEAQRSLPREQWMKFMVVESMGKSQATIIHSGFPGNTDAYLGDLEALAAAGLLQQTHGSRGNPLFDISPVGFAYYRYLKTRSAEPSEHLEGHVRRLLDSMPFQGKYPAAYARWLRAEQLLWTADSKDQLTTIGHICREALQEFATTLIERVQPPSADPDPARTVSRIKSVIAHRKPALGDAISTLLDALIVYWGTVIDLTQRQEHGAQKEGAPLTWEDGRRVVFQTACVMFELDRALG